MTPLPTSSFYREPSKSMGSWREHREEGRTSAARRPAQSACRAGLVCVCVCALGNEPQRCPVSPGIHGPALQSTPLPLEVVKPGHLLPM